MKRKVIGVILVIAVLILVLGTGILKQREELKFAKANIMQKAETDVFSEVSSVYSQESDGQYFLVYVEGANVLTTIPVKQRIATSTVSSGGAPDVNAITVRNGKEFVLAFDHEVSKNILICIMLLSEDQEVLGASKFEANGVNGVGSLIVINDKGKIRTKPAHLTEVVDTNRRTKLSIEDI